MWAANGWPLKAREDEMTTATGQTGQMTQPSGNAAPEPPREPEAAPVMAEANIFALNPAGFKVHIKLPSKAASIVKNVDVLLSALSDSGYTPDLMGGGKAPATSTPTQAAAPVQGAGAAVWVVNPDGTKSCSVHGQAAFQAPGVSRATGKPYAGFWKCTMRDCRPTGEN